MTAASALRVTAELPPAREVDSTLLLALAALLIFNSHLEQLYPLPWLAADGLLGNSLFFLLSGYGIQSSLMSKRQTFGPYLYRRLIRLYPTVLLAALLLTLPTVLAAGRAGPRALCTYLIWPTPHTYVMMIVPLYVGLFFVGGRRSTRLLVVATGLMLVGYSAYAFHDAMTIPNGTRLSLGAHNGRGSELGPWATMFAGAVAASARLRPRFTIGRVALTGSVVLSYLALKYLNVVRGTFVHIYPVLTYQTLVICLLSLATLGDPRVLDAVPAAVRRLVRWTATLTLEIYVVHEFLLGWGWFDRLPFPVNIAALLAATLICGVLIHDLAGRIRIASERWHTPRAASL